jgi:hypothetical protein
MLPAKMPHYNVMKGETILLMNSERATRNLAAIR